MTSLAISTWTNAGVNINASDKLQSEAGIHTFHLSEGKIPTVCHCSDSSKCRNQKCCGNEPDCITHASVSVTMIMIYVKCMGIKT
jgi:copper homeostasis protein CutC